MNDDQRVCGAVESILPTISLFVNNPFGFSVMRRGERKHQEAILCLLCACSYFMTYHPNATHVTLRARSGTVDEHLVLVPFIVALTTSPFFREEC